MKLRKKIIAGILFLVMMLNACGSAADFTGSWKGSFDVTEMVKEIYVPALTAADKTMAKHIQLEGMLAELTFVFAEDSVTISMDDTAKAALRSSIETALTTTYNAYMEAKASKAKMELEAFYAINGTTQEKAIADFLKDMKVEQVVDVVAGAFQVSGTYGYDAEKITIVYEDDTWETMQYAFEGKQLTITIRSGEQEIPVVCQKTE